MQRIGSTDHFVTLNPHDPHTQFSVEPPRLTPSEESSQTTHLKSLSSIYQDDQNQDVMERYFFLMSGDPACLEMTASVNLWPDDHQGKRNVSLSVKLSSLYAEYSNCLVRNLCEGMVHFF